MTWRDRAACAGFDPETFYPRTRQDAAVAKEVCRACPVRRDCLEEGLRQAEVWGVWGGLHEDELREVQRRKALV